MIDKRAVAALVVAPALLIGGCTNTKVGPPSTVTVDRTVTPAPSASAGSSKHPGGKKPITTTAMHKLPGACDRLLPAGSIDAAVHGRVAGRDVFVVGVPDASIGRVGYINCQYGVPHGNADVARIEIQVSLYRTPSKATARIGPTIDDYTQNGATAHKADVLGFPATLLTGGSGAGYGPTELMALGQRTVVVALRPGAFAAANVNRDLSALAGLAARRTSAH